MPRSSPRDIRETPRASHPASAAPTSPRARPKPLITSHQVIQMNNLSHTPGENLHLAGCFPVNAEKHRWAANRVARMAKHYATTESRVDEVKIGFELLLPSGIDGVPPTTFVIDGIKLIHNKAAGEPPKIRLTSDLPEGGYTVDFPLDAVVTMIVESRDDD